MFEGEPKPYLDGQTFSWEQNYQYAEIEDYTYQSCKEGDLDEDNLFTVAYTINRSNPSKPSILHTSLKPDGQAISR